MTYTGRRRKIVFLLASLVALVITAGLIAFLSFRMGYIDGWLTARITKKLTEFGVRLEVGSLGSTIRGFTVEARDVKLFVEQSSEPFATIDRVTAVVSLRDILGFSGPTEINLRESVLEGVRAKYVIDSNGRSNLDGIHPSKVRDDRFDFRYQSAVLTVRNAEILYIDQLHKLDGTARNVALQLSPAEAGNIRVDASSRQSEFVYDGRPASDINVDLTALLNQQGASVQSLEVTSPVLEARVKGELRSWREFDYGLEGSATVKLSEAGRIFVPGTRLSGLALIDGTVEGKGSEYQVSGKLRAPGVVVRDVKLDSLALTASGSGKGFDAAAKTQLAINALEAAGFRVNRFSAVGDFSASRDDFSWSGRARADKLAGKPGTKGVTAFGMTADRVKLDGPFDDPSQMTVSAGIRLQSLLAADVRVGNVQGDLKATSREVVVTGLHGSVFGGEVNGAVTLSLVAGGRSEVDATVARLNVDQGLASVAGRRLPLRGLANGKIDLNWNGTRFETAAGNIDILFDGNTASAPGAGGTTDRGVPLTGEIHLIARGREFQVDRTRLRTGSTELNASGTINLDQTGNLALDLKASDAAELEDLVLAVAEAIDDERARSLIRTVGEHDIEVAGDLRFQGRISGKLKTPGIVGDFSVESISARRASLGQLKGELDYRGSSVRINDGHILQADGGRADFSLFYPFEQVNGISLTLQAQRLGIAPFARFMTDERIEGSLTGSADLTGLPGDMHGKGIFTVDSPKYADFAFDDLKGRLTVEGPRAQLEEVKLRLGQNFVTVDGWWNTSSNGYQIKASGDGLDIGKMLDLGGAQNTGMTGLASVKLDARSDAVVRSDEGSRIFDNLVATINASDLKYNGQSLGTVQISANGQNSLANLDLNARLLDHDYKGSAQIDFTRRNAPTTGKIALDNVALHPIVELASEREFSAPGTVAGELRLGGNLLSPSDGLTLEAALSKLEFDSPDGKLAAQSPILIKLQNQQVDLGRIRFSGKDTSLEIDGTVAIGSQGRMAVSANGDLNLRMLQNFVKDANADGVVRVTMTATGTFDRPRLSGSATLSGGVLRARGLPISLTNANGRLLFTADQAQLETFTADAGGGRLTMTGGAALSGFAFDRWRLEARLSRVRVDYPAGIRTTADGDLTLQGNRQVQVLSGLVSVRRAEYIAENDIFDLIEEFASEIGGGSIAESGQFAGVPPTQLDLHVLASDSIAIKNKSLDIVGSADVRVIGTLEEPLLKGRVTVARGLIEDLFKEEYRITSGLIDFPGISQRPPRLSIEAETVVSGYRLTVLIAGPFDNLRVTPRSEPPLPQADVIALMTSGALPREGAIDTGSPSQALASQTQSPNLATLLASPISSRIGTNVTGRLFGLNRFAIDPLVSGRGTDPTARITVGRRITKDLSITFSTNLASNQDQVVLVEYRASDRLSFVASRAEDGAFGIDVRLRRRF